MEILNLKEKTKINFQKTQNEKFIYLGEFKENVISALKKQDIDENIQYRFLELMKKNNAKLLKISRDLNIKNIKRYIEYAEKIGLKYRLVDNLSYEGDIGMVIVSKEPLNNKDENIVFQGEEELYKKAGLVPYYWEAEGKKICKKHYKLLEKNFPKKKEKFELMGIIDKILGYKCPICKKENSNKGDM